MLRKLGDSARTSVTSARCIESASTRESVSKRTISIHFITEPSGENST